MSCPARGRRSRWCGRCWIAWEWARSKMDRILFGDNQFFGVNHMSEEKARQQAARFQDLQAIIDVLDIVYEEGIRVFMCTTQDRMVDVCEHFRQQKHRYPGFKFYPCMPYAQK